jgi:hypothetical protein
MIITVRMDPPRGQLFEAGCLDENVGEVIEFMINGKDHISHGTITAATVADDRSHAWLTVEVPNLASNSVDIGPAVLSTEEGPDYTGYAEEGF